MLRGKRVTNPDPFSFQLPTQVRFGESEIRALPELARELGLTRPLLVTGSFSVRTPPLHRAAKACQAAGVLVEVWDGVVPNPTDTSVREGLAVYQSAGCDGLIGYGGGSAIDTAKAIGVLVAAGADVIANYCWPDPAPIPPLPPLIAVPTTAGTGSEVSWVSIVTLEAWGRKAVLRDPSLFPAVALVDPALTHSMPPSLTAHTGFDAFTHAIETFTSGLEAPVSDPLAWRSMELIVEALPRAVRDGADRGARYRMSLAATMAGIAFTNGGLHSGHYLSHVLTARYGLPHGLACILTIPALMEYIWPARPRKMVRLAQLFGASSALAPETAAQWVSAGLRKLMTVAGVPSMVQATGDTAAATPALVEEAMSAGPELFSPRPMDAEAYHWVLTRAFEMGCASGVV
jgi:alcohol dehydrogenase